MVKEYLHRFYKKSHEEKIEALKNATAISEEDYDALKDEKLKLATQVTNIMIEKYIMRYELPIGLAINCISHGIERLISMLTEEPSVVAAAYTSRTLVGHSGGFQTAMKQRLMIEQIALKNV